MLDMVKDFDERRTEDFRIDKHDRLDISYRRRIATLELVS